jgi:hypothetical protein
VPVCAQAQQPSGAKLKADAQNVVKIISGDKAKTQTYCQIDEQEPKAGFVVTDRHRTEAALAPDRFASSGKVRCSNRLCYDYCL